MPRFDPPTIAKLKAAMRLHSAADGYRLTPAEEVALAAECALTKTQVHKWCADTVLRYADNVELVKFLQETTVKVISFY